MRGSRWFVRWRGRALRAGQSAVGQSAIGRRFQTSLVQRAPCRVHLDAPGFGRGASRCTLRPVVAPSAVSPAKAGVQCWASCQISCADARLLCGTGSPPSRGTRSKGSASRCEIAFARTDVLRDACRLSPLRERGACRHALGGPLPASQQADARLHAPLIGSVCPGRRSRSSRTHQAGVSRQGP